MNVILKVILYLLLIFLLGYVSYTILVTKVQVGELISALATILAAVITLRLAEAAEGTSKQSLEISKRLEAFEYKSESPYLFVRPHSSESTDFHQSTRSDADGKLTMIRIVVENAGSGTALNVTSKDFVEIDTIPYIAPGSTFPKIDSNPRYNHNVMYLRVGDEEMQHEIHCSSTNGVKIVTRFKTSLNKRDKRYVSNISVEYDITEG